MKYLAAFLAFLALLTISRPVFAESSPISAQGSNLYRNGQIYRITGVNWFGFETGSLAPHGLWSRNYKDMMDQMKKSGFNTIRLPYSNDALKNGAMPNGIDLNSNPDLKGLTSIQVMDKIVAYAGQIGMNILLDRHRPDSQGQSALWYTSSVPESQWISDWKMLASHYKNTAVIGADLHNEPRNPACWGCNDATKDWRAAAERAGNAILESNPYWLIVVEGIEDVNNNWYWWGGNLTGVKNAPIKLSNQKKLVYSSHDYPSTISYQSWFNAANYPNNLSTIWDNHWGYIQKENIAPILVGEFGTRLESDSDKQWIKSLVSYMKTNGMSFTYWSWNPNSGDTGGILEDDWTTIRNDKLSIINTAFFNGENILVPSPTTAPQPTETPQISPTVSVTPVISLTPTSQPTVTPTPAQEVTITPTPNLSETCTYNYNVRNTWDVGMTVDVTVKNIPRDYGDWNVYMQQNGHKINEVWNATVSQNQNEIKFNNVGYNGNVTKGGQVQFGFNASKESNVIMPTLFMFNGVTCNRE